jgi:mannose-6-phosphate isomerase-like protein (cupin superfamily)
MQLSALAVNARQALDQIQEYWSPRIIGRINDQYVKAAKIKGEFVWHNHAHEDEMFFIIHGSMTMQLESGNVELQAGDFFIVPKGMQHSPKAEEECGLLLIEPVSTLHTGDVESERTVPIEKQLVPAP